jgi:hypothetical protein
MAKITLPDFIKSASGTIARKRYSDGTVKNIVITKNGTMYESTYHPRTKISEKEKQGQSRFAMLNKAFPIVRQELGLCTDPETRKKVYAALGAFYDRLAKAGKKITPEILASLYAYLEW